MNEFWGYLFSYWWLLLVFGGAAGSAIRGVSKANERKRDQQIELAKVKAGLLRGEADPLAVPVTSKAAEFNETDVARVMGDHDDVNRRWLDYELDVAKLIDFPTMTDVRNALTVAFLRAKRDADALRPLAAHQVKAKSRWDDYRNVVNAYEVAFEVAEKEARRIRDNEFSEQQRQRLKTARQLIKVVEDQGATAPERRTAYQRARKELDGLLVLPDVTVASLEQKVAGMLDI